VPALVGPIVGFALGVLLSWLSRREAARGDETPGRARVAVVALLGGLVFAPVCAYFVVFAGDWALFYLTDSRAVPSALLLVLVVVDAVSVVGGFQAGHRAARRRADRALLALLAGPAAVAATVVLSFLERLRVDGTYHQVSARFGTRPVAGGPLGYAILWMSAMVTLGVLIAARALADRPDSPRVTPPSPVRDGGSAGSADSAGSAPKPPDPTDTRPALLGRRRRS
jgi:hypothetical protein